MDTMHLFAGIGGGLLADRILGHNPIVAVEWDKYACQVLRERAADGWFPNLRVWEGDVRLFDPSEYAGKWIAFMQDSLARILALPANRQELAKRHAVASTVKSSASLAWYDQNSCSWKTSQQSLLTDSEPSSMTWPRSGMTRNGYAYELPTVGRVTSEIDGGFLATPTTISNQLMPSMMKHKSCRNLLAAMLPTPTAHDRKKGGYPSEFNRNSPGIGAILGGTPSPMFQEWQMGYPINHTALKASETAKSPCKPQSPTDCSEVSE